MSRTSATAPGPAAPHRLARSLYAVTVQLLPRALRRSLGADMRATFAQLCNGCGSPAAVGRTLVREALDIVRAALRVRLGFDPLRRGTGLWRPRDWRSSGLLVDARCALRGLRHDPRFALLVVLTLGLGIGASTSVFSLVDSTLLRPLPYADPDTLAAFMHAEGGGFTNRWPPQALSQWRRLDVFEGVEAFDLESYSLAGTTVPVQTQVGRVTPGMFTMLGVSPRFGRGFLAQEGQDGRDRVVLLSWGLASRRFGTAAAAIGHSLRMNGEPYRIVGVMAPAFHFPYQATNAWTPWSLSGRRASDADASVQAYVRLRRAMTVEATQQRIDTLASASGMGTNIGGRLFPARRLDTGLRRELALLIGAVGLLMLIACANTANLLLARVAQRQSEIAVRAALGAGRRRLLRQAAIESLVLAAAGGLVGALLARQLLLPLAAHAPARFSVFSANRIDLDLRALGFAIILALGTALLFGTLPATRGSRPDLARALGNTRTSAGRAAGRVRAGIVVAEIALTLVLLTGAGLFMTSLVRMRGVDPGFDPEGLLSIRIIPPTYRYTTGASQLRLAREISARLAALPSVASTSYGSGAPPSGANLAFGLHPQAEAQPPIESQGMTILPWTGVASRFFETLGVEIVRGRGFTPFEVRTDASVIVVNESLARRYWGSGDPVGHRFRTDTGRPWRRVVGVVADVMSFGPASPFGSMQWYVPLARTSPLAQISLLLRSDPGAPATAGQVRATIWSVDPELPIESIQTMRTRLAETRGDTRFYLVCLGGFALLACILAAVGTYAVVTYAVAQRRREIGIRIALGAGRARVWRLVLWDGARLAAVGIAIGIGVTVGLGRFLESMLFGVHATDPAVLAAVALGLGALAIAACWVPARRILRLDPTETLRAD